MNCQNEKFCMSRVNEVLSIKTMALQDIDFYQNQIAQDLKKYKGIHGLQKSKSLLGAIMYQFAEYRLACYIYAFSTFLDIMLQTRFVNLELSNTIEKMRNLAKRYEELFLACRSQIAVYQRSSIEAQIVGNIGIATKNIGKTIASIPVIKEGPVDELLISAGESIGKHNQESVRAQIKTFEFFESNPMSIFIDNVQTINLLYTSENAMITDGMDLYVLQQA
ncbi:MAG: hypothetical protein IKT79_05275, partial [Akkermansia sp.]|nr:hypothetical protein [Akkermansia sp.]